MPINIRMTLCDAHLKDGCLLISLVWSVSEWMTDGVSSTKLSALTPHRCFMVAQWGDGGFSASVTALSSLLTGDLWRSLRPLQLHLSYMLFHTRQLAMVVGLQITLHLGWKS